MADLIGEVYFDEEGVAEDEGDQDLILQYK